MLKLEENYDEVVGQVINMPKLIILLFISNKHFEMEKVKYSTHNNGKNHKIFTNKFNKEAIGLI